MALRKKFCLKLPAIFADEYDNRGIRDYNGESLAGAAHTEFGEDGYDIMVIDLFRDGELVGRYFADKVTSEHKGWDVKAKRKPDLTNCKKRRHFAYTLISERRARIA